MTNDLLRELEGRGVRLAVEGGRLVAHAPQGTITPELAGQIRAQKAALMTALTASSKGQLAPLPEPLTRLIHAAVCEHLNYSAELPGGRVSNLGVHVLATAALYATGKEAERHLQELWAARGAWAA